LLRPGHDLLFGEWWQLLLVADPALAVEEAGERGPARQAAIAMAQRPVDPAPRLIGILADRPRVKCRPRAGAGVVVVGPNQDLRDGEGRPPQAAQAFGVTRKVRHKV